jgi:hypothetical protein
MDPVALFYPEITRGNDNLVTALDRADKHPRLELFTERNERFADERASLLGNDLDERDFAFCKMVDLSDRGEVDDVEYFVRRFLLGIHDHRDSEVFSHNGNLTHAQLEEYFNPHDIGVGFDGLEINL